MGRHLLLAIAIWCGIVSAYNASITPLSIPPSDHWDGDDGQWSSFQIEVGTPGQLVRLYPSTSASAGTTIWVVISEGCVDVNPDLANCANARGNLFQSNTSTSWSTQNLENGIDGAIYGLQTYEENFLGLQGNGSYGYDTVSLGVPGSGLPTIEKQVIAGIWTDDFFLGSLGLSPVSFNFTSINEPQPSMLSTLYNQSLIPSRSWGYTAGAYYKDPPVFGSLTLGGYDTTRFQSNNLSFSFGADFSRDLLISLQSITYDTIGATPLLASSIDIFIDSLVTEIWLPTSVCDAFAQAFNLTWNEQGQLYLIEDEAHTALVKQNPTFTFEIGQAGGGGQTASIVLPYAAFDLNLTAPIVGNATRYFPLKQAQNSTQYTLGRTFLQEAYVVADYERHNFSVSQALFPATSVSSDIVAIHLPSDDDQTSSAKKSGLSAGAIAGIAVGAVAVIALVILGVLFWRRQKKHRGRAELEANERTAAGVETTEADKPNADALSPATLMSPELDASKYTTVHEMNEQYYVPPELPAYEGPTGRHELVSDETIHEMDGREISFVRSQEVPWPTSPGKR